MSNETSAAAVISEKTSFSWPVVVVIAGCLVAVGGGMSELRGIQKEVDVLRSRLDLLEHQQGADRGQINVQAATLGEVKALVLEVRNDVRDVLRARPANYQTGR